MQKKMGENRRERGAILRRATVMLPGGPAAASLCVAEGRVQASQGANAWSSDLRDHLIFPALVNTHDHLHLNCFPPLEHALPFPNSYAWMDAFQPYFASPAIQAAQAIPAAIRHWHGALKNLLCGATTVLHHDPCHSVFTDSNFPVEVLRNFGWCHSLGLGQADSCRSPLRYGPEVVESFQQTQGSQPWIIHLAEGTDAVAAAELEALDALGCLAENTMLVHGVGLTETDIDRIVQRGAGVVWCPGSNLAMLGHTLQPRRLSDAGLMALGSDSRVSSCGDLLTDLKLAALHSDLTAKELVSLMTEAPARMLKLPKAGCLTPGAQADLLIVRETHADPYAVLPTLQRSQIRAVVRGGLPAIADPDFADWFDACALDTTCVRLDGVPKLCATNLLGPPGAADLEPGLQLPGRAA